MTAHQTTMLVAGFAVLLVGAVHPRLQAQQTTPNPTASSAVAQETIKLDEFDVAASKMHGYEASETMTGPRINTPVVDLPYPVVSLTNEFFSDFGITVLDENLTYIGGFSGLSIGGGFNLRGFSSTSQLRDGFYRLGRYGSSNVDRIEIIAGSNAGIYGRTSPGGMLNMISLQPKKIDSQELRLSAGGYNQTQARLKLEGSIDKAQHTYYVMTLAQIGRRYDGSATGSGVIRNNEAFAAVRHDFSDTSHLKVQAEYFLNYGAGTAQSGAQVISAPRTADVVPAGVVDPTKNKATTTAIGLDTELARFNPFGTNAEVNRGSDTFLIEYDKQINDVWSIREGLQYFRARAWSYNNNGWAAITLPAPGGQVTDVRSSAPTFGRIMEDGGGSQTDIAAHYGLFNGAVDNKSLLTVDFNDYYRWDPTFNYNPASPAVTAWLASGVRTVPLVPVTVRGQTNYIPSGPYGFFTAPVSSMWSQNPVLNTLTRRRTTSLGGNFSQQIFLLDKRLILFGGVRDDNVRFSQRDFTVQFNSVGFGNNLAPGTGLAGKPGGSVVRRYFHELKPDAGFNYRVTPDSSSYDVRLFGSFSESYFVDQTSRPQAIASPGFQPQVARGWDYGIKGSFFNNTLIFTLDGYYAEQFNVAVSEQVLQPDGTFQTQTLNQGNQTDKGFELNVNWAPNENWDFVLSAAEVNAKYSDFGTQFPEAVGRSVQNMIPENGSLAGKYTFTNGLLRGLDLHALVTYISSFPNQGPSSGDTTTLNPATGKFVVTAHTDAWKIRIPGFTLWTFGLGYDLPDLPHGLKESINFNVSNAFGRTDFLKTSGNWADGRSFLITYTLSHY